MVARVLGSARATLTEPHQRARLLGAGAEDAARPMVLEAPPDQPDAVGKQGGRQTVAGMALAGAAVEAKAQRPAAIDQPALARRNGCARAAASAGPRRPASSKAAPVGHGSVGRGALGERAAQDLVAQRVARDDEPLPAAGGVLPVLAMRPARIGALDRRRPAIPVPMTGSAWRGRRTVASPP